MDGYLFGGFCLRHGVARSYRIRSSVLVELDTVFHFNWRSAQDRGPWRRKRAVESRASSGAASPPLITARSCSRLLSNDRKNAPDLRGGEGACDVISYLTAVSVQ